MGGVTHDTGRNPASPAPGIEIETVDHGPFPEAPRLNPKLSPELPLLLATLRIVWEPADAMQSIARLEQSLLAFSPRFRDHECRGAEKYHVFRAGHPCGPTANGDSALRGASVGYLPRLALAHLIEHAVIDALCSITGARRCSGATGMRVNGDERFDILVECPDARAGRASFALALSWICLALQGVHPGPAERDVLKAARLIFTQPGGRLSLDEAALGLGLTQARARQALDSLVDVGYLRRDETPGDYRLREDTDPLRTSMTP